MEPEVLRPDTNLDDSDCMPKDGDAETDAEILKDVPNSFAIDCEEHANWLVKKVMAARSYSERVRQWAEREQRRAAREEHTLMFLFGRQIEEWTRSEITKLKGRRKSINLPAGMVGFRTVGPSLHVDDEDRLISWAIAHCPSTVVTVRRISIAMLKEHVQSTGELPESGAYMKPGGERFFLK